MNETGRTILWILVILIIVGAGYMLLRTPATPPVPVAEEEGEAILSEPIKIGYIGPLTGELADGGEAGLAGATLALNEINDTGGILGRQLELVAEDDKCSAEGVNAMNKLVNIDKVVAITGPDCSASGGPALPVAQSAGVPVVVRWASAPHLTKVGDYIFRVYPSDAFQGKFISEFLYNDLGKKKVAVVYVKNDWGQGIHDVFSARFKELGGEVLYDEGVTQETTDLRTPLTKVKNTKGVEALFFPVYPNNGVAGLKQAKELGLKVPIVGGDAFDADEVIKSPTAEGVMYSVAVIQNQEEFQKKVSDATGKRADKIPAPMAYDGIKIIADAITRAGSTDGKAIRDEIAKTSYQGVSSPRIEFDENGDLKQAQFEMKVIKAGKAEKYTK